MKTWKKILFLLIGFGLISYICSCGKKSEEVFSGDWKVTSFQIGDNQIPETVFVSIDKEKDDKFQIYGKLIGGNSFSGMYKIPGTEGKISLIDELAVTKLSPSPELAEYEKRFLDVLENAEYFKYGKEGTEEYITILSDMKNIILLTRFSLTGCKWSDASFSKTGDGGTSQAYMIFGFDGYVRGNNGLNDFELPYEFDPKERTLKISDGAMTLLSSDDEKVEKSADQFMKKLFQCAEYSINGDSIILKDKKHNQLLEFYTDGKAVDEEGLKVMDKVFN